MTPDTLSPAEEQRLLALVHQLRPGQSAQTIAGEANPQPDIADLLTSTEVLAVAGCTYRQLDFWCRTGYLTAARPARGSGYQRLFTPDEAEVARRMTLLVRAGLLPWAAIRVARFGPEAWLSAAVKVSVVA